MIKMAKEYRMTNGFHHCPVLAKLKLNHIGIEQPTYEGETGNLWVIDMETTEKWVLNFIKCCPFCEEKLAPIKIKLPIKKICNNCKHWNTETTYYEKDYKYCVSKKFVNEDIVFSDKIEGLTNLVKYNNVDSNSTTLVTGKDFGCIFFENKDHNDNKS